MLYVLFCLVQLPLYYALGKAPQGYDFAIKRVEAQLAKPVPDVPKVQADLESASRRLDEIPGDDSRLARLKLNQAIFAWFEGKLDDADKFFRQSVETFEATHGPDSWHTNAVNLRYAEFLMHCRRFPEALEHFEGGTRAIDDVQGPNTPFALRMNCRKVMLLNYLGRPKESAELAERILPPLTEQAGMFDEVFLRQVSGTLDTLTRKKLLLPPEGRDWAETLLAAAKRARTQDDSSSRQE